MGGGWGEALTHFSCAPDRVVFEPQSLVVPECDALPTESPHPLWHHPLSFPDGWRGGSTLAEVALSYSLIDQLMLFIAPKLLGGSSDFGIFSGSGCTEMAAAIKLEDVCYQQVGEDLLITGDIAPCLRD